jgi:hypothetical protein
MRDPADILYDDKPTEPAAKSHDAVDVLYREQEEPKAGKDGYNLRPGEKETEADPKADSRDREKPADAKDKPRPEVAEGVAQVLAEHLQLDPNDPMTQEFSTTAAELGLGKDGAEKLAGLHTKHSEQYWGKLWDGWIEETKTIPQEDITAARGFVKQYGDESLTELLNSYQLGNHPALVRAFARAAKGKAS